MKQIFLKKHFQAMRNLPCPRIIPCLILTLQNRKCQCLKKHTRSSRKITRNLSLALISDLVYGSEPSWKDPVKYSFTHGGKDGFPYPVNRKVYDHSIQTLKDAIEGAKLDNKDKYFAVRKLNEFLR